MRVLERITVATLAIVAFFSTGSLLWLGMEMWPLVRTAREIDGGRFVPAGAAAERVDSKPHDNGWAFCRRDVMMAAGLVDAATVEALVRAGDLQRIAKALDRLGRTTRDMLSCSPTEALAWTWLAIVRDEQGAPSDEVARLVAASQTYAPTDYGAIEIRLPAVVRMNSRRGGSLDDAVRKDIRTLFAGGSASGTLAEILGPLYRWVGPIAEAEYRDITDQRRREAIMQAFGPWKANIGRCDEKAFVDWLYRFQRGTCETSEKIPSFDAPWRDRRD